MKKKVFLLLIIVVIVIGLLLCFKILKQEDIITFSGKKYTTLEYGEVFDSNEIKVYKNKKKLNVKPTIDMSKVNYDKVGTYPIILKYIDKDKIIYKEKRYVTIKYTKGPEILLKGSNPLTIPLDSKYEEPGYILSDKIDKVENIKVKINGTVDTSKVGTYKLIYIATNTSGNKTEVTRKVIVEKEEIIPSVDNNTSNNNNKSPSTSVGPNTPVKKVGVTTLQLHATSTVYIEYPNGYVEAGYTAYDTVDGDITQNVKVTGHVNTTQLGTYQLTYSVINSGGKTTTVIRTVIVRDTTAPTITINGNKTIHLEINTPYIDLGATAADNYDSFINVTVNNSVNTGVEGVYYVMYTAKDSHNNISQVTRKVVVVNEIKMALVDIAKYYYNKGKYIQYDQKSLDKVNNNLDETFKKNSNIITTSRRQLGMIPEDATRQNMVFVDCSAFIYNVYKTTTGFKTSDLLGGTTTEAMMNFAKNENGNSNVVVMYHENTNSNKKQSVLNEFENNLQIGDVVVYREYATDGVTEKGHVMLYIGNNKFLHATGNSYNYNKVTEQFEENGAIEYLSLEALINPSDSSTTGQDGDGNIGSDNEDTELEETDGTFDPSIPENKRYLFGDNKINFAILRMTNDSRIDSLTEETVNRRKIKGIDIEKVASVNPKITVSNNQQLKYSIILKNVSNNAINNIIVKDEIPTNTNYMNGSITGGGSISNNKLEWNINLEPQTTVELSYSVKVNSSTGKVESSNTQVSGITINNITHYIGNTLTESQTQALLDSAHNYASLLTASNYQASGTGNNYRLPPEQLASSNIGAAGFIRAVYYNTFGIDIRYNYLSNAFDSLVDSTGSNNNSNYNSAGNSSSNSNWLYLENESGFSSDLNLYKKMQVPTLYGGRELTTYSSSNIVTARSERARYITTDYLMSGDIVTYQYTSNYTTIAWLYLEETTGPRLIRFGSAGIIEKNGEEAETFINDLLAKRRFVVLRPTLAYNF